MSKTKINRVYKSYRLHRYNCYICKDCSLTFLVEYPCDFYWDPAQATDFLKEYKLAWLFVVLCNETSSYLLSAGTI